MTDKQDAAQVNDRAAALAHAALFARLLRLLETKNILSRADVHQLIAHAVADFQHPQATEFEWVAQGHLMHILDRVSVASG